jgi:preprotein translocase subunit YajC
MTIKIGDKVKLESGEVGTVISAQATDSKSFPYVYEVKTESSVHVTNNVTLVKKSLAKLISITLNQ